MTREWVLLSGTGALAVAALLIRPLAVWWAWNTVMPALGVPSLTLWQAIAVVVGAYALQFPASANNTGG